MCVLGGRRLEKKEDLPCHEPLDAMGVFSEEVEGGDRALAAQELCGFPARQGHRGPFAAGSVVDDVTQAMSGVKEYIDR